MNIIKKTVKVWDSMPPWAQFWLAVFAVLLPLGVFIGLGIAFGWAIWGVICAVYLMVIALLLTIASTGDFDRA